MGYYVKIVDSTAFIPRENLQKAYEVMCALNITHDHVKRGGRWAQGEQTARWFSWMDKNYPETCENTQDILEMMGFDVELNHNGDLMILDYDNKTGQEDLFLKSIENLAHGKISWQGEDGRCWTTDFYGDSVITKEMPAPQLTYHETK